MNSRYSEWIDHLFNHEVADPSWWWDLDAPEFDAPANELADMFILFCKRCGEDLNSFTDEQISQGLWYLFGGSSSEIVIQIKASSIPLAQQAECILSMKSLYTDLFNEKCSPVLSYSDNSEGQNPVNLACYMLWDMDSLLPWSREQKEYFSIPILEVLNHALRLPNIACVESGLHGLGHYHSYAPEQVEQAVQAYLDEGPDIPENLRKFAECAKKGYVE